MLKKFDKVADFIAKNDKGEEVNSKQYLGNYTVLYFYPKAFTPGCTKECNAFSENIDEFLSFKMDDLKGNLSDSEQDLSNIKIPAINVVGVSPDKVENLADFKEKYQLKIELLSDPDKKIAKSFEALKENASSILRSTFILDPWGRVKKAWYGVKVKGHVEEVLEGLREVVSEDLRINPEIKFRRASRAYSEEKVAPEILEQVIKAAHLAPSCFNKQPWRFSIIDDRDLLERLYEQIPSGNYWMEKTPAIIAVHSRSDFDCQLNDNRDYYLFDTGIAVGNLLTQATQMGLLAHPIAGFNPVGFKETLNIPEENVLITVIGIGYPGEGQYLSDDHLKIEESSRDRNDLSEVLNWNTYDV
ncbi:redoxin domain-containing protein [Natronospora cellulosivora (SeqCode)]